MKILPTIHYVEEYPYDITRILYRINNIDLTHYKQPVGLYVIETKDIFILNICKTKKITLLHELCHWLFCTLHLPMWFHNKLDKKN